MPAGFDRKLALRRGSEGDDLRYLRCACGLDEKQSGESAAGRLYLVSIIQDGIELHGRSLLCRHGVMCVNASTCS